MDENSSTDQEYKIDNLTAKYFITLMLKYFLEKLKQELPSLSLDNKEDGSYILFLDNELHITLMELPSKNIAFRTTLAPLPATQVEHYLERLLQANLFGLHTGGNILGLSREGTEVVLVGRVAEQALYKEFRETLEDFANYAESWREETLAFRIG